MSTTSRTNLIKAHLMLATFIFPAVLMFLITGGLYTWGIKGSYDTREYTLALSEPLTPDQPALQAMVQGELRKLAVADPAGAAKVKKAGNSFVFEWTGSQRDVLLEPTDDALSARLTVKETTWYRNLVQLHKAKGGVLFKVYAAVLATGLFVILASGYLLAWQVPKFRRLAINCSLAGVGLFILAIALS